MRGFVVAVVTAIVAGMLVPATAWAAFDVPAGFDDQSVVGGVPDPTAIAWLPETPENGDLLIATRDGILYRYPGTGQANEVLDLSATTCAGSETGLLGLAVDPEFAAGQRFIYLYYTRPKGGSCVNRVSQFTLANDDTIGGERVLIDNISARGGNHNGGDLQFGNDGLLYISVGDGGVDFRTGNGQDGNANARRLDLLSGKILRIETDGSIPAGNPFRGKGTVKCALMGKAPSQGRSADVASEKKGKKGQSRPAPRCREIFATGLRNPYRIAFDGTDTSGTQRFYINDVGGAGFEEINEGERAADYGWNRREGPCPTGDIASNCRPDRRFVEPLFAYGHGNGGADLGDCSVITGGAFAPNGGDWPADYFFADFGCDRLFALEESDNPVTVTLFGDGSAATHLAFGPDGALYYTTFDGGGQVRRIVDVDD